MVAVGGLDAVAALLTSAQALLRHEPGHAITAVALSLLAQFHDNARAAVGLAALLMNSLNVPGQH